MKRIKSLIIDTNLLLLLVVGLVEDGRFIQSSKRLTKYTSDCLEKVFFVVEHAETIYITPYIATEVSNLIDLNGYVRKLVMEEVVILFNSVTQIPVQIVDDTKDAFIDYGLTDNSLITLAKDYTIFTDDLRLADRLHAINHENVLLLQHVRQ
ncbi:hypothetical protein [Klebsiella sp. BIGb0407]|uniref:hypothetical protein n=1 Tax=Klebsiella sp. BIGb0407 TaxID=2940603 RepID=UPI002168BE6D|nr:hypothetical protein [Klebsiella sp. BIGb0407]